MHSQQPSHGERRGVRAVAIALGLILAAAAGPAAAQQLNIHTYTNGDGLPQQQIFALHQDATGYLWLGSFGGASRYDGQRFRTFNLADGLRSNFVAGFAEDALGRLWAATRGGGLCRFDGERFKCLGKEAGLPSDEVNALASDRSGGLWAATSGGLAHLSGGPLQVYTKADGLPSAECRAVLAESLAQLWVGTSAGLARRSGARFVPVVPGVLGRRRISVLLATPAGLVIGTDAGAYLFKNGNLSRLALPSPLTNAAITGGASDADGRFWLTTLRGGAHFQEGRFTLVSKRNGLPGSALLSALVDRESNVWLGTAYGLSKLIPGPFLGYTESQGLPHSYVGALAIDGRQRLWIGMPFGGIAIRDGEALRLIGRQAGLTDPGVFSLLALPDGRMLGGTHNGLVVLAGERVVHTYRDAGGLPLGRVTSLLADGQGAWVGSEHGLAHWRQGRLETVAEPALRSLAIYALARDQRGRLWAGLKSGGIIIYDGHTVERLNAANGLTDQTVWQLALDREGAMWVATEAEGAFRVQNGAIRHVTTRDGLVDDAVWQVLCDRHGNVWLYTSHGLDRYDGHNFRHYGRSEGLIDLEGSNGAVVQDAAGELWFGTGNGLERFVPQKERINAVPPAVVVRKVESSELGKLRPGVHISNGAGVLTFRFAALSFRDPAAVRYRYRFVGLHERWTEPRAEASVSLAGMAPGAYVFEVTGSNDEGVYAAVPARFAFVVDPLFWQTWWFRFALAMALVAALRALYWWRIRTLKADRRSLEQAVAERTVELNQANGRLRTLATTDELTGLANRRQFQQTFDAQICSHLRTRTPESLSLLLLDLDHFKQINDCYGHPAGDAVLTLVAERLRAHVRVTDLVARYGGEEFAVILPATNRAGAAAIASKLHAAIRGASFEVAGEALSVTVSVGTSTTRSFGPDIDGIAQRLLQQADEALYRAKGEGRDRIVAAGPVIVHAQAMSAG
jgi:diguanylate cyclase (GGDEF)-like protein